MSIKNYLFILFTSVFPNLVWATNIVVVGNLPANAHISIAEVKQIYLENGVRVTSGEFVQPIDYHDDNELRDEFYRKILEKNRAQMKAYWARRVFTGKGTPPKSFANLKEAREFLNGSKSPYILYLKETETEKSDRILLRIAE